MFRWRDVLWWLVPVYFLCTFEPISTLLLFLLVLSLCGRPVSDGS